MGLHLIECPAVILVGEVEVFAFVASGLVAVLVVALLLDLGEAMLGRLGQALFFTLGEGVVLGKAGDALFVILTFVDAELRLSLLFIEVVEHLVLARAEPAVECGILRLADLAAVGDGAQGLDDRRHL